MADYNRLIICGNVGKDPELREGDDWKIARFSVATNRQWRTKGGEQKKVTTWHNVVVFNPRTCDFIMKYVTKGSRVLVEGRLELRDYETSDGDKRVAVELVVDRFDGDVSIQSSPQKETRDDWSWPGGGGGTSGPGHGSGDFDDDIPF